MVRLAVSVEGPTEREFVTRVLAPALARREIRVHPIVVSGCVSLKSVKTDLRLLIANRGFTHVTTMYDFYGFQERGRSDPTELEQQLRDLVGDAPSFIPYVQVHEFEALLFAGPQEAAAVLRNPQAANDMLRVLQKRGSPEEINDGYDTCPSRQMKRIHPAYDKVNHGYLIVEKIGLPKVRKACPRFGSWLTRLEQLSP